MNKKYRYLRIGVAITVGVLAVLAFVAQVYPVRIFDVQLTALFQRVLVDFSLIAVLLLAFLLITAFLFGRIYCSTLCPLGLLQEFLLVLFRRNKREYIANQPYKYFLAAVVFGALVGGTAYLVRLFDPYTLFGSAMSQAWLGLGVITVVAVLVWFKKRFFCTNVCPVGVVLGLISKHSACQVYIDETMCVSCGMCTTKCPSECIDFKNKRVDNETCVKCLNCLTGCPRGGLRYGRKPAKSVAFNLGRRKFIIGAAAVALFATAVKGGKILSQKIVDKFKAVLLPAGAGNPQDFANRCLNCNLCVQNCPMKIIKKADADYPAVHIDYGENFCDYDCHKCSEVCPSGAIKKISLTEKQETQIGVAVINQDICVKCGLCVRECPREIISKEDGAYPDIAADKCIGCGACQSVCPVKAIKIYAAVSQRKL